MITVKRVSTGIESKVSLLSRGAFASAVVGSMVTGVGHSQPPPIAKAELSRTIYTGTWALTPSDNSTTRVSRLHFHPAFFEAYRDTPREPAQLLARHKSDSAVFISLLPSGVCAPEVTASEDETYCEWAKPNFGALISFEGDGTFGYALLRNGRFEPGEMEVTSILDKPRDLLEYLKSHFAT